MVMVLSVPEIRLIVNIGREPVEHAEGVAFACRGGHVPIQCSPTESDRTHVTLSSTLSPEQVNVLLVFAMISIYPSGVSHNFTVDVSTVVHDD